MARKAITPLTPLFPCTKCGACCKHVNLSRETAFLDSGNGICKHFDNKRHVCLIYNTRPDICRIDKQYLMNYQIDYSWEQFIQLNLIACLHLQDISIRQKFNG